MAIQIQLRNDTAANWTTANPVLAVGELGLESDTGSYKIGNGVDTWSALPYGGVDGASAYEIAVSNGFVGDETAWLASLVGAAGADGVGVPAGGTEGQVLAKVDGTDYNTAWVDATGGGSADALTVLILNSDPNNAINAGDIVVADQNSGNGIQYIGFKMPTDGSGNNFQFNQVLGIAIEDIAADFGQGRVAVAGSISIPVGKISSNGPVYIDSNNGALSPGPSGNPLWNTPIGRSTSNNSDTTTLTIEKSMVTQRLLDIGDVNVNYGTVSDGDVLSFNGQTYQFEMRTPSGGGGGTVNDNLILNGGFDIWQEINESTQNTTKTTVPGSYYFADNWKSVQFGGTGNMVQERIIVRNAIGPEAVTEYGLQTTVTADAQGFEFVAHIEDVNTIQNENVSVSAWVKRSAGGFVININDQNFGAGGSPTENIFGPGATLNADEWTKIQGTVTFPETYTKNIQANNNIAVKFNFQGLQPNEVVSIAQVKVERGSSVTAFKPMYANKAQELLACKRYYVRHKSSGTNHPILPNARLYHPNIAYATSGRQAIQVHVPFATEMRTVPTLGSSTVIGNFRFLFGLGLDVTIGMGLLFTEEMSQQYANIKFERDSIINNGYEANLGDGVVVAETADDYIEFIARY